MDPVAVPKQSAGANRLDRISLGLSILLFVSPWLLGYAHSGLPAVTAWVSAIVIAIVSVCATLYFAEWEEWVNLFGGLWLLAAPWVLNIAEFRGVVASFTGIGVCVAAISLSEIWAAHHPGWLEKDVSKPN